jgi:type IV secretion system protein VirD4
MNAYRILKVVAVSVSAVIAAAALALLWSANYAAAVFVVSGQSNIWAGFTSGHLLLPVLQAWTWWGLPVVSKLVTLANAGLTVEAAIIGGSGYLLIAMPWKVPMPRDGSRIATLADLRKAELLNGKPGYSMLLGTFQGHDVRYSGDSHFYVNGPTRSGKGRGFVMPNLLEWRGSAVVLDVKQENLKHTGAARIALGQKIYVIAPGSPKSHCWNPLDVARPWPWRSTDLSNLAASLVSLPEGVTDPYWAESARGLLSGVLGYVTDSKTMQGRRNIRSALRMFSEGVTLKALLDGIVEKEPDLNRYILDAFNQHRVREPKQRGAFEGHIMTSLKAWNNSLVAAMTSASDFDIRKLRREPFTIYLTAPVSDFGSFESVLRLLIQQIHDVMLREEPGADEPHKVVFMLDEFYQFQRLPEVVNRAPMVASHGFRIALIAQNIPQIDERYSRATREALLGNMDINLIVAVGDKTTGDVVSEVMGKHYVEREGWGESNAGPFGRRSRQGRWEAIPLMTADQLRRLDQNKTVLTTSGHRSAVLDKLNFYTDERFIRRRDQVAHFGALVVVPELKHIDEWPLFEAPPLSDVPERELPRERDRIKVLATHVFRDERALMAALEAEMSAIDGEGVRRIVRDLRLEPQYYGPLLGADRRFDRKGRKARAAALATVPALIREIARERRNTLELRGRLQREGESPDPQGLETKAAKPNPGTESANATSAESGGSQVADPAASSQPVDAPAADMEAAGSSFGGRGEHADDAKAKSNAIDDKVAAAFAEMGETAQALRGILSDAERTATAARLNELRIGTAAYEAADRVFEDAAEEEA